MSCAQRFSRRFG